MNGVILAVILVGLFGGTLGYLIGVQVGVLIERVYIRNKMLKYRDHWDSNYKGADHEDIDDDSD